MTFPDGALGDWQEEVRLCGNSLHPMVPENTYVQPSTGHRRCRACAKQTRKWR